MRGVPGQITESVDKDCRRGQLAWLCELGVGNVRAKFSEGKSLLCGPWRMLKRVCLDFFTSLGTHEEAPMGWVGGRGNSLYSVDRRKRSH